MEYIQRIISKAERKHLIAILVILAAIPVTILLVRVSQEIGRRAAGGPSALRILPASQTKNIGETGQASVYLDPGGANVSSVEVVVTYEPGVIEVTNIVPGPFFTNPALQIGNPIEITKNLGTPGRIHYALGFPLGSGYSSSATADAAVISFKTKGAGTAPLAFVVSGQPQTVVSDINAQNVLGQVVGGTVNVTGGARLYFSGPNPGNPQSIGGTFTLDVLADTAGAQVAAVDALIRFDPAVLQVSLINKGTVPALVSYPALSFDNAAGTAVISANIGSGTSPAPVSGSNLNIGKITFRALSQTTRSPVTFDFTAGERNDSNIVRSGTWQTEDPVDILASVTNVDIVVAVTGPTPTPKPTPTPTQTLTPTLTPTPAPPSGQNVAPNATVTVSSAYSGNYAGTKAVDGIIGIWDSGEWASAGELNPWIQLSWASPVTINLIRIYDRVNSTDHSAGGSLSFSDGSLVNVTGIPNDGTAHNVSFSARTVSWVRFQISGVPGSFNNGLSEIEVYSTSQVPQTPTPTPTPKPTATPTPLPSQGLKLILRFQGRLRAGAKNTKTVDFSYRNVGQTLKTSITFQTNDTGEATVNMAPGNYVFLFEADGYLARRFGNDSNPVVIQQGTSVIDLTASPLLGGDFNDDNEVNEVDYVNQFLPSFLGSSSLVDLDGSGEVNNLDFAIMRANWNLRDDTI